RAGIREVILNLHHLPQALETFLGDGSQWEMKIAFSKEQTLLGTGGGVKKAEPFFDKKPFVLVNCDFISNVDLLPLIKKHEESRSLASMVLWDNAQMQAFYSKVGIDGEGRLVSLPLLSTKEASRTG